MQNKQRKQSGYLKLAVILICLVVAVLAGIVIWKSGKTVNSFEECKAAGGAILESYPEQCVHDGKSFTNDQQSAGDGGGGYVGLPESAALAKASIENKKARVVERNGEALPVTMDYVPGRLNLFVKDGNVYKVQVEGKTN